MTDGQDMQQGSPITVGDIQGTGIAVGHGSFVSVTQQWPTARAEAAGLIDEMIRQLALHRDALADPEGVIESAEAARSEVAAPTPRWPVVRGLLRGVAAGVVGISTLADAVDKVQELIGHLIK